MTKSGVLMSALGSSVVLRVTAPRHRGWAVQDPPMHDVLEQSPGHEPHDDHAAGHDPRAGESIEPEGQKCQRRGQVAEHRDPVIGRAVDDPIQGAEQNSSGLSGHQFTHSIPIPQERLDSPTFAYQGAEPELWVAEITPSNPLGCPPTRSCYEPSAMPYNSVRERRLSVPRRLAGFKSSRGVVSIGDFGRRQPTHDPGAADWRAPSPKLILFLS